MIIEDYFSCDSEYFGCDERGGKDVETKREGEVETGVEKE